MAKRFLCPSLRQQHMGIFPMYLYLLVLWEPGWAPGSKSQNTVRASLWLSPWEWLTLTLSCPHWASPNSLITVPVSHLGTGSCHHFCFWVSAPVSHGFLYSPVGLSNFGDIGLPWVLFTLTDSRRVVGFLVYSPFSCCWDRVATSKPRICRAGNQKLVMQKNVLCFPIVDLGPLLCMFLLHSKLPLRSSPHIVW